MDATTGMCFSCEDKIEGCDTCTITAGAVATCLGNVGPGIGDVGPMNNFSGLSDLAKFFLSLIMIIGRLELFTILFLFTPYFWKVN